jgi:hypothetical protein
METFGVRYQEHKYTDLSDNPNPKIWRIKAESPEQAFALAQQRAKEQRAKGRKIGHVFREMFREDGTIVVAEGDYI